MDVSQCPHYKRQCNLKAVCCDKFYACHRCHDESGECPQIMDRTRSSIMQCRACLSVQPIGAVCRECDTVMSQYYCSRCVIYDENTTKLMWHCHKCGVCRVCNDTHITVEHCDQCNTCMPLPHTNHVDVRGYECPICRESVERGTAPVIQPGPCEHLIHSACFEQCIKAGIYKCPLCHKTFAGLNMESCWRATDRLCEMQPTPLALSSTLVHFICNDCGLKSVAPLNLVAYKCPQCSCYNTAPITSL